MATKRNRPVVPAPKLTNGAAAPIDPKVEELKAQLEALGFQVKPKRDRQNIIPELLAELKAVVEKHGGTDKPNVKSTFIRARKELWPITEEQRAYNKAQAEKRKAREAERDVAES